MTDPSTRSDRSSESGIALISALLLGLIGVLMVIGLLTYAMGSEPLAKRHTDWNASLGAAQAGVDDYIYRLNKDPEYWRYGTDQPVPEDNPALTSFVDVPGSDAGSIKPQFKYRVIAKPDPSTGARIILEVTGKVGNVERVLRASMARRGFLDYMYFTDYEQSDPILSDEAAKYAAVCTHWYDPEPVRFNGTNYTKANVPCTRISFGVNDVINGPLHTNDQISISGPVTFNGLVTTSLPPAYTPRFHKTSTGVPNPTWNGTGQGSNPIFATPLELPATNAKLMAIAEDDGCVYTGPTQITFRSDGRMNVLSPNSTRPVKAGCGTANSTTGVNATGLNLPSNGVIYVQAKPASASNKYYTTACRMNGLPTEAHKTNDHNRDYWNCKEGDAFISGTLKGRVTIGSERDITVVDDMVYNTPASTTNANSTDMLGLIANNFVQTYHPIECRRNNATVFAPATANMFITPSRNTSAGTCTNITPVRTNLKIHAAILALQHSFRVPEYGRGAPMGDLTVVGAIAQKYRGAVATGSYNTTTGVSTISTGYRKDYTYDGRLAYQAPPYFLDPVTSAWRSSNWMETKAGD